MGGATSVWIAHSSNDPVNSVCHMFEQALYDEALVLNESPIYRAVDGEERDIQSEGIYAASLVVALLTPDTVDDEMVALLRRATILKKPIVALFWWAKGETPPTSLPRTTELRAALSGAPHLYVHTSGLIDKLRDLLATPPDLYRADTPSGSVDMFVSKRSVDYEPAKMVTEMLKAEGRSTFLSEESLLELGSSSYMQEIDEALDRASHLVVVATRAEHLLSGWVEAEWRTFVNEKRSGRKTGNVVTVVGNEIPIAELPIALRQFEVIQLVMPDLRRLLGFV